MVYIVMTKDGEIVGVYHNKENAEKTLRKGIDEIISLSYDD